MPGVDGIAFKQALATAGRDLPTIFITALEPDTDIVKTFARLRRELWRPEQRTMENVRLRASRTSTSIRWRAAPRG